jgi:hypothetical protein
MVKCAAAKSSRHVTQQRHILVAALNIEVLNLCEGCVKGFLIGSGLTKFRVAAHNGAASVLHKMVWWLGAVVQ